jgi:hypothetical protein
MKSFILFALSILSISFAQAQNNLVIFSEEGENFILHVNGLQINKSPETRVLAEGITNGMAAVRVVFDGNIAPDLKKNIPFLESGTEINAMITQGKSGYKLKYFGETTISTTAEEVMVDEVPSRPQVVESSPEPVEEVAMSVTTVETVTQTTEAPNGENVNMSIGIDGFNMNVNVKVDDSMMDTEMSSSSSTTMSTTTTTTTTTTSTIAPPPPPVPAVEEEVYYEDVVTTSCSPVMKDVSRFKQAIENESFADDQLMVAKQSLKNACITVEGVKALAQIFDFEDDRLEFVKYAYERTADPENFYELNSVFTFSDSKEELNDFLETK